MANNIIRRKWNQNALVSIEDLSGSVFQAESGGHTFEISGVDNYGNTVTLSGTVSGVFMRSDNTDVAITGTASGGIVTVTLPAECYDVPGRFGLTVFVTADSKKTAVYAAIGTVRRTSSGSVAPGTTADVVDLINAINTAVATIPQSWSGLMADIAPTYSTSAVYPVGAYVYYDGDLYRCTTAITTAESWTAAHWTAAVLGDDVSDIKSAFDSVVDTELISPVNLLDFNDPNYVVGKLSTTYGTPTGTSGMTSGFIPVEEGKTYNYTYAGVFNVSQVMSRVCAYDSDKTYLSTYTQDDDRGFTVPANSGIAFIRFSGNSTYFVPTNNCMFTEGMPTKYSAYFAPYYETTVKNSALDMDDAPTADSEKPVKSGGVYEALAGKQSALTFDDSPTSGSSNPVKSGGVYDAVAPIGEITETELIVSPNLLNLSDPDFAPQTKLSSTYGTPTAVTGQSFSTGFIPVEEGKTYNWIYGTSLSTSQVISRVCAYNSSKNYLSSYTQDNQRGFTVPANSGIAFIRFSGSASHLPPNETNVMFTEGFLPSYQAYFDPYYKYTVKNSALDADYIRSLGVEETVFPEWEHGSYNNSWVFTDSTNTIMSDYIPVGDHLTISVPDGYMAKVYPFTLAGERNSTYPIEVTGEYTIKSTSAQFVQITFAKTTPETVTDPNTYGLNVTIIRYGNQAMFDTQMSANPNVQDVKPENVLPQYLSLVAVKEKNESGKMTVTVGYLYRTVTSPYKLYYAQGKPENIKYLCDWDSSIAGESNNTPIWYCFGMTDEGDIICVHRGEIESSSSPRVRDNPIVYPHTDYAHPVLVELSGTKPTSWISNSGDYAESGHFFFGEYIRKAHAVANVWDVSAPYTSAENWQIIKTYERDIDPSDPSSMVLGKIEHIHHVSRDPFSGVLYVTTGDHYTEARIDYLKNGTWGILAEADEEVCRQLNFVYTPTYVYWASDAFAIYDPDTQQMVGGAHKFFRAKRDSNGLIDLDNLERYEIPYLRSSIATYHVCYIKNPECILILDRQDDASAYTELPFHVWNIKEERLEYANQCKTARGNVEQFLGFRCECCQHYPNLYDSVISVGFSLYPNSIAVCGNPNPAIIPAQGGNTATDSVNANQVNSMTLKVVR